MMATETLERLKILNTDDSYTELAKILPPEVAASIVEGDVEREREDERCLHEFLDRAAKEMGHR